VFCERDMIVLIVLF